MRRWELACPKLDLDPPPSRHGIPAMIRFIALVPAVLIAVEWSAITFGNRGAVLTGQFRNALGLDRILVAAHRRHCTPVGSLVKKLRVILPRRAIWPPFPIVPRASKIPISVFASILFRWLSPRSRQTSPTPRILGFLNSDFLSELL
jgi:hypothetical protein